MDSAFYHGVAIAACRRADVRLSVTARMNPKIARTIAGISEHTWTPIKPAPTDHNIRTKPQNLQRRIFHDRNNKTITNPEKRSPTISRWIEAEGRPPLITSRNRRHCARAAWEPG